MGPEESGPRQVLTLMLIISFAKAMALIYDAECLKQDEHRRDEERDVDEPARERYCSGKVEQATGKYQESP